MSQSAIILPMAAMVLLTMALALNTLRHRIAAVKAGQVRMSRFRAMQGDPPPERVAVAERAFHNTLEIPPLFHAGCIAALAMQAVDETFVVLAWLYVALRLVHTAIFISYNNITHRLAAFLASCAVLLVFWGRLALAAT